MQSVIRSIWRRVEIRLRSHGYVLRWHPQGMLGTDNRMNRHFDLAAAHLMLRKKDIFFVEIGANDGIANDPIHPFVRDHGWSGLMLEPLPEIHAKLTANYAEYPSVRCIQAAVSHTDGEATIYTVRMEGSSFAKAHQFSSFRRDVLLTQTAYVANIADLVTEIRVPTMSWSTLVAQAAGRFIDVVQIDTEGFDAEIVRMIDFRETRPAIVHYEHCNLSKADQEDCATRLVANGYSLAMNDLDVTAYRFED